MMGWRKSVLAAAALLAACGGQEQAEPDAPASFAVQLPVAPAPGEGVQRVTLPPAALVALRQADFGDLRIFDKNGQPLTLALEGSISGADFADAYHEIRATPFNQPQVAGSAPATVRIEQAGQTVAVQAGGTAGSADRQAVLIDTRKIEGPVDALFIRAALPKHFALTVGVAVSDDLRQWQPLGDKVLYRTADNPELPDVFPNSRLALHGVDLRNRYVMLSWTAAPGVAVTGVTVATPKRVIANRIVIPSQGARLDKPGELTFAVNFAAPLAAVRVTETGPDGPVPVTLLGRSNIEEQWTPLASGIVRQDGKPAELELSGATARQYKLVADQRTGGFSKAPKLELLVEPVTVLAGFNGQGPYRLAIGNPAAKRRFLSIEDLAESAEKALALPNAKIDSLTPPGATDVDPAADKAADFSRKLILWLVLLAGVAVLGFAVVRLMRKAPVESEP
jgi:hypothetical protein